MVISESIESLNQQLTDLYGIDTVTGQSIWRIVWSDDQREKRKSKFTDAGIELLTPQVVELPKYPSFKHRHVLENLVLVPEANKDELAGAKISYEPIFVFESKDGTELAPRLDVCQLVINTIHIGKYGNKSQTRKYVEDYQGDKRKRLDRIHAEFFGNETDVTDALHYGEGVALPSKHFGEE